MQVIHNAADPAASTVDVYVEEVSTDTPFIDDFAFRTATEYRTVPAGVALTVTVAPGTSSSADDGIASFTYTLEADQTYQLIANGVLDPGAFEANPDGEAIGFALFVNDAAQEVSTDDTEVQFNVVHGSTDAPTVDVVARDVLTLVDNAAYSDITDYIGVPAANYTLDVTTPDGNTAVATFAAELTSAVGGALTVLASGFLSPENDEDGPAFGLLAVFPDGTAALLPEGAVSNEGGTSAVASFELSGVYPNPFRADAAVQFSLGADARVALEVYDVLGRRVLQVAPELRSAGADQQIAIDAATLPSGAYLYRLTAETATERFAESGRMTVVR